MKLVFLFVIFSLAAINAEPLINLRLFKRGHNPKITNAMEYANYMKNVALNKYSGMSNMIGSANSKNNKKNNKTPKRSRNKNKVRANKQNTVPIKDDQIDTSYFAEITVGNQNFNMLLDTGSSDIFVPSKTCTSATCRNHNTFDSSKSSTFKKEGNPWNITFGIGSASGVTGIDDVQMGGFTAKNQIFGLADNLSDDNVGFLHDGILGLAFDGLNTLDNGSPTFITNLINQNQINPLFSFHLSRASDFNDQGTFTLGGVDNNNFQGNISFNNVIPLPPANKPLFWLINLQDASVNKKSLNLNGRTAIIDTGTTTLVIPTNDALELHKQIPGAVFDSQVGAFVIPCVNNNVEVALQFGGVTYPINPRDLILQPINGTSCASSILPGFDGNGGKTWLVGDVFLKNVFSVFNVQNPSVGFAFNK